MKVIKHLKNLLHKKPEIQPIPTALLPYSYKEPEVEVPNEKLYERILLNLKNHRAPLSIKFGHSPTPYVSMLLDVDANKQFIIVDEINSPEGHQQMCMGDPFAASSRANGVFVLFQSKLIDYGTINDVSFYLLPYPRHIEYLQRRVTPRMAIPADISMFADFLLPGHPYVRTHIEDISLTGLRFSIKRNVKSVLDNFAHIEHCRIITPFFPTHELTLNVRHCRYDLGKQRTVVGCQFINVDNIGLKFLSSLISRLQQYTLVAL